MSDQGLLIARYEVKNLDRRNLRGSRFRLEVQQANGDIPVAVFLYRRRDANEETGEIIDEFIGVCSPSDLDVYPVGDPDLSAENPYLRLSYVELDFQAQSHHEDTLAAILTQLDTLVAAYKRMSLLGDPQEYDCGSEEASTPSSPSTYSE